MPSEFSKLSFGEKLILESFVDYRDNNGKK